MTHVAVEQPEHFIRIWAGVADQVTDHEGVAFEAIDLRSPHPAHHCTGSRYDTTQARAHRGSDLESGRAEPHQWKQTSWIGQGSAGVLSGLSRRAPRVGSLGGGV